jgi:hypothetical protein
MSEVGLSAVKCGLGLLFLISLDRKSTQNLLFDGAKYGSWICGIDLVKIVLSFQNSSKLAWAACTA